MMAGRHRRSSRAESVARPITKEPVASRLEIRTTSTGVYDPRASESPLRWTVCVHASQSEEDPAGTRISRMAPRPCILRSVQERENGDRAHQNASDHARRNGSRQAARVREIGSPPKEDQRMQRNGDPHRQLSDRSSDPASGSASRASASPQPTQHDDCRLRDRREQGAPARALFQPECSTQRLIVLIPKQHGHRVLASRASPMNCGTISWSALLVVNCTTTRWRSEPHRRVRADPCRRSAIGPSMSRTADRDRRVTVHQTSIKTHSGSKRPQGAAA